MSDIDEDGRETSGYEQAKLPAVPDDAAIEPEYIFEGEIVDEPEPAPKVVVLHPVVQVFQTVTVVIRHPHTRTVARHAAYVPAGVVVLARSRRRGRTLALDFAHQAKAAGDHENGLRWAQQHEAQLKARHDRHRERMETLVALARSSHWIIGAALFLMVLLNVFLVIATHHVADLDWSFLAAAHAVALGVQIAQAALLPVLIAAPVIALVVLREAGRRSGLAPRWAQTAADADVDTVVDEAAITQALRQLRIPQIGDYLKTGQPMAYIVPCRQEGRGTYAEIRLPGGLPAGEIAKAARRERLAAGLYRHTKEVWPTTGADNSHLKLWVADKGALEEGAGPYPLLEDGTADVFDGVPFGRTLRGDPVMAPLMERNTIAGGMPGQGKSSAARAIMCGAALDPRAELWIMIPDINFDFELMKRRCSRYVMGAEDEHAETIRDWLADLREEVQRRGQLLVDHEIPAVTRKLAGAGIGLHPMIVLLEEAHVAIQHHIYGKEIAQLLTDVVKLGRKRGIHVIVSTQAPTKDSMPRDVTRNCSNGIAFAVGDHVPNDALLGAGAYRAGHRATELIPGTDRGVAVVKGFSGERSEMVQVYFVSVDDPDQVTPLIDRAMAAVARRGGLPGGTAPLQAIEARDLLADLAEALGGSAGRVRLADLPARLRKLAPSWGLYRELTGRELKDMLDAERVRTTNTGNVRELDPADLRHAIGEREADE